MKNTHYIVFFVCLFVKSIHGQEVKKNTNYYNVSLETPLFFKDWYGNKETVLSINFEFLSKRKYGFLSSSFSLGKEIYKYKDVYYAEPYASIEVCRLLGKRNHFFELGVGMGYSGIFFSKLRLGYRFNFARRLLFRIAFTPSVYLERHIDTEEYDTYTGFNGVSLSFGYRFKKIDPNDKSQRFFSRFSNTQLNFQPFFKHYEGYSGLYSTISIELLLAKMKNLSLRSWIGYSYGPINYAEQGFPIGLRIIYGKGKYFIENGIGLAWHHVEGNYGGDFFTLQPELAFRTNFGKRLLVRLAYSPYWWLSNKSNKDEIKQHFSNSLTFGIGYRFH